MAEVNKINLKALHDLFNNNWLKGRLAVGELLEIINYTFIY